MKKEKLTCIFMIVLFVTSFSFASKALSLENGVEQDNSLTNYDYSIMTILIGIGPKQKF